MYALSVTFHYPEETTDGAARLETIREYMEEMHGLVEIETYQQDSNHYTIVSKWENKGLAQSAFARPGVNDEIALRAGIVVHIPDVAEMHPT